MAISILAIGVAVASTSRAADDAASAGATAGATARPDRAKFEAARQACEATAGFAKGVRPTQAQDKKMRDCMKEATGMDRPPGPPPGGRGDHHRPPPPDANGAPPPPPPPPDDAPPSGTDSDSSSSVDSGGVGVDGAGASSAQ